MPEPSDFTAAEPVSIPPYQGNLTEVPTMTTSANTSRYIGERKERSMIAKITESTTSTTTTMSQIFAFIRLDGGLVVPAELPRHFLGNEPAQSRCLSFKVLRALLDLLHLGVSQS